MKNLYAKFMAENPGIKLSFTSFCRIRPAYIRLTRFISRSCCLCTRHQNFALCTSAMRKCGLDVPLNPEKFIEDDKNIAKMKTEIPSEIEIGQWKRVPVDDKGKKKMIMRVVTKTMKKDEFLEQMDKQTVEFTEHVGRVKRQYEESLKIKKDLAQHEAIVHMDFSENYSCRSVNEIQSAYWNQSAVTLHPVVIYYKDQSNELCHKSMVIVSDELGHTASTVLTFIDNIVPEVKNLVPAIAKIHYFTDSPTSQYRNKTIFNVVANHADIYGCKAVWNYFEAGHGKGPCDGLGGSTKRMADEAVNAGKVSIQDAEDFYKWTQSQHCSMSKVLFKYVSSVDCQANATELNNQEVKSVKGTMKFHAVVGLGQNSIMTSNVSCYCQSCVNGQSGCTSTQWIELALEVHDKKKNIDDVKENSPAEDPEINEKTSITQKPELENNITTESETFDVAVGSFVAATYDKKVYIGKVLQVDEDDNEVEITFMEYVRSLLQWPKK